jgi:hypothetical protein
VIACSIRSTKRGIGKLFKGFYLQVCTRGLVMTRAYGYVLVNDRESGVKGLRGTCLCGASAPYVKLVSVSGSKKNRILPISGK